MFRKFVKAIVLALVALVNLPVSSALAGDNLRSIPVRLELVQTQFRTEQDVNNDGQAAYTVSTQYKAAPGRAESTGFTEVGFPIDPAVCPEDYIVPFALPILIYEDALVFNDLSVLHVSGSGLLCFDFGTGAGESSADLMVTGGKGRFEGASGLLHVEFFDVVSPYLEYAVWNGTLRGSIQVPN